MLGGLARRFRFKIREGTGLHRYEDGHVESFKAGDEVVLSETEAAALLRGKGRRGFELLEVIDDSPARRRKLPG
jgi:hypothetical protein